MIKGNAECQCSKNLVLFEIWALNVNLPEFDIRLEWVLNVGLPDFDIGLEWTLNVGLPDFDIGLKWALNVVLPDFDIGLEFDIIFEFGILHAYMAFS